MPEPNKRLYVDFDDVICETARHLLKILYQKHGKRVSFEDIKVFDISKSFNITSEETMGILDEIHSPNELLSIDPVEGAVEGLKDIFNLGCEIHVVTGRPPWTCEASHKWLENHDVPYSSLNFMDKYSRYGKEEKMFKIMEKKDIKKMGFSFAVEDSADMAHFLSENYNIPVSLLDRPWNRAVSNQGRDIKRCEKWSEIAERIEGLC